MIIDPNLSQNQLVRRQDLDVVQHCVRGETRWTLREPWSSATFQLNEHEFFILSQLEGDWSAETVCQAFEQRFAPLQLSARKLFHYLHVLHREGLVVAQHAGQGEILHQRNCEKRNRQWWAALANPLVMRMPGIDLSRHLQLLTNSIRFVGTRSFVVSMATFVLVTLLTASLFRHEWIAELSTLANVWSSGNWLLLLAVIGGTKVLHELGHAVTLHLYGGRCRETGALLLVFAPCLYCDVSDAWMFANKWRRIAVSLAGIGVDLVLASAAFWIWWTIPGGPVHQVALTVMLVCTVNTLLLNGNPFMRYDGYYVLSDWAERPNLAHHARQQWGRLFAARVESLDYFSLGYGLLSFVYRIFIFAAIFIGLYRYLSSFRLEVFVVGLALWMVVGTMALSFFKRTEKGRGSIVAGVAFLLLVAMFFVPLPSSVDATAVVQAERFVTILAPESGWMKEGQRYGDVIAKGNPIVRVDNPQLNKELAVLAGQCHRQKEIIATLMDEAVQRPSAAFGLALAKTRDADLTEQWRLKQEELRRLIIVAPLSGEILPPMSGEPEDVHRGTSNRVRSFPLSAQRNVGYVERGEVIGRIAGDGIMQAIVLVAERDRSRIHVGMPVDIRIRADARQSLLGHVVEISDLSTDQLQQASLGHFPNRRDGRYYVARVALREAAVTPILYGTARARFRLPAQSCGARIARWCRELFYFGG